MQDDKPFVLHVQDKNGLAVDVSAITIRIRSLPPPLIGHVFQLDNGFVAKIVDKSQTPPKEYKIDQRGRPVPI